MTDPATTPTDADADARGPLPGRTGPARPASLDPAAIAAVDAVMRACVADHDTPGVAWGVVLDGALVHAGGAGTTDVSGGADGAGGPVPGARTLFRIASMTKSFTAAAVLALRDDGAFRLDDPIAAHVPEAAALQGPTADSPAVTVRDLLCMGGGLPSDDAWADRHLDITDAELAAALVPGAWFAWTPGTAWQYSNLGYALLGRLVAGAAGRSCQAEITARLLRPLGLHDTVWAARPVHTDRALGHRRTDDRWVIDEPPPLGDGAIAPMGGLWSTVADLAGWVAFLLDAFPARDGRDDGPLRRASRREMQQAWRAVGPPHTTTCAVCGQVRGRADGYGAGLRVAHDTHLGPVVAHAGGLPGFGSNMRWLPERGVGVVALGNATYAPMSTATLAALDALHHGALLPPVRPRPVPPVLAAAATALVALLDDWDDRRADALFADNVALDDPYERRRADAAALVARLGRLTLAGVSADGDAEATVTVRGERGTAELLLQLHPLLPPKVQWYEATVDEA